jgi:hypothetical protein
LQNTSNKLNSPSNFTFIINATATTTSTSSSSTNYQLNTAAVTAAIWTGSPSTYIALPTHSPPPNQRFPDTRELTNHEDINYSELLQDILETRDSPYPNLTYYDGMGDSDAAWPTQSLLGKRSRDSDDDGEDGRRSGRHTTAATRTRTNSWTLQELNRYLEKDRSNLLEEQSRTEEEAESERASLWSKAGAAGLSLCLVNEEAKRERKRRKTQEDGAQKPDYDPLFASNFHVPGHESSSPDASPSKCEHSLRSNDEHDVILQPETRPISQEELVAEVQGIYAGLVMVEAKCIEVEKRKRELEQAEGERSMLSNEQWQALIALHRTLLHEHHDFFLASQHPSASPVLRLANSVSKRIEGILPFNLPEAQESDDTELWSGVASDWYSESERTPTTGLYQHLAILSRHKEIQRQLDSKILDSLSSTDVADSEVGKSSILANQSDQSSDTDVWSSRETLGLAADPVEVFGNPTPVIAQEKHAAKDISPPSAVIEQEFTGFSETVAGLDAAEWNRFEVDTEKSPESTLQQQDLALDDEN